MLNYEAKPFRKKLHCSNIVFFFLNVKNCLSAPKSKRQNSEIVADHYLCVFNWPEAHRGCSERCSIHITLMENEKEKTILRQRLRRQLIQRYYQKKLLLI